MAASGDSDKNIKDVMKKNFDLEDLGMSMEKLEKSDIHLE
jgi:hypothetical protein